VPTGMHVAIPTKGSDVLHDGPYAERCEKCAAVAAELVTKWVASCRRSGKPVGFGSVVRVKRDSIGSRDPEWVTITNVRLNTYTGEVWLHAFALGENLILTADDIGEVKVAYAPGEKGERCSRVEAQRGGQAMTGLWGPNVTKLSERYKVVSKYVPPAATAEFAPGEHYILVCTEPERHVGPDAYRHYSFYRTRRGSEVASDLGYHVGQLRHPLAKDGEIFLAIKEAVERYDRGEQLSFRCPSRARKSCCAG